MDHLQRQHWLKRARTLARSGAYANVLHLERELRSVEGYDAAAGFLEEPAIRHQLKLLCERSYKANGGTGTAGTPRAPGSEQELVPTALRIAASICVALLVIAGALIEAGL